MLPLLLLAIPACTGNLSGGKDGPAPGVDGGPAGADGAIGGDAAPAADARARLDAPADAPQVATAWHAGTFRYLPALSGDLVDFVSTLSHPNSGGYMRLDAAREAAFAALLVALDAAIADSLAGGASADWCQVQSRAADAGYEVVRFHDTTTSRWFVYLRDATTAGQAYLFFNPQAKRDLVVESPHAPYDSQTDVEGARIFRALAARAFLLNKEHRCSAPEASACDGSGPCSGGNYRESDVAHHTANTFHVAHRHLSDGSPATRFVQLHGMGGAADSYAEIADSTTVDHDESSVSVLFAANLDAHVPEPAWVDSCQEYAGSPPVGLCASTNVQGRYTHAPAADECTDGTSAGSQRFLHIEQRATLRDDDETDGWSWGDVRDALLETWPACTLGDGPSDCALGPMQDAPSGCTCGEACT